MNLLTFPYYRFFRQNTLFPILAIAKKVDSQESNAKLAAMLLSWWNRKLYELYFIQVAVCPFSLLSALYRAELFYVLSLFTVTVAA